MYYVLMQFLETMDSKNVATCVDELRVEVQKMRIAIEGIAAAFLKKPES